MDVAKASRRSHGANAPAETILSRRALLSGAAALVVWPTGLSATPDRPRTLRLNNPHTGERFDDVYHDGRTYDLDALARLDWFLRDHHSNQATVMDMELLDQLWALQERFRTARGAAPTLLIHSAYRTQETNDRLRPEGAVVNSYHLRGKAVDVSAPGYGMRILGRFAQAVQAGGLGLYWSGGFVHLDTGPMRSWFRR